MGGVVADRAFARGLSVSDGVTTYVAWASPARRIPCGAGDADDARGERSRTRRTRAHSPPRTSAIPTATQCATSRERALSHRLSGVVRLDLRLATDALVSSSDARDPGVDSRVLLPASLGRARGPRRDPAERASAGSHAGDDQDAERAARSTRSCASRSVGHGRGHGRRATRTSCSGLSARCASSAASPDLWRRTFRRAHAVAPFSE